MFARDLDKPLTIKRGPLHKGNIMDLSVAAHGPNYFFFFPFKMGQSTACFDHISSWDHDDR